MNDMESRQYLESELETIKKWEKEQKDVFFWEKIGRIPFMLLDRLTPKIVRDKVGEALNEVGGFIQSGGKYLVRKKSVLIILTETAAHGREGMESSLEAERSAGSKAEDDTTSGSDTSAERVLSLGEASKLPIGVMDTVADGITAKRVKFAAAQGAATGIGGIFTMAADIPLVLGQSLRVLQEMALCYGYDPDDPRERVFIVKCLQFSSADIVGKKAVLEELAAFDDESNSDQVFSQIQGWREVVQSYTDSFGMKKLFQLIPIAGIVFGSISNKGTIGDVAEAGKMLYKKRRVTGRLKNIESPL
ncbi:EcsC protein family protein [Paenibacillus uliginis N3/975]|uniref:EcsC protein family protein n=1 Tax=Paenibacillus uliginis N3/975 TaxID=1313296 RepID=A0A1X7HN10_9BACL|nr:EcsC family protein [Paenibacillus uliginis]SMF89546.1 EcsC protein family protein [Paenibacillus uliginis N3/975]